MKAKAVIAVALFAASATAAFAQDMTRDQLNQRPPQMQPNRNEQAVSPTMRSNDSSMGGAPAGTSKSGTLMQQRERGMAPDSTQPPSQDSRSTGTIKQ